MTTFLGSLIVAALFAQAPAGRGPTGEVLDDEGKPVADAQVVFYSPPTVYGNGDPVEAQTRSDSAGKFSLKAPPLKRVFVNGVNFLTHRPGLAITAHPFARRPYHLVLEKPLPRTVLVEGPDGKPVAGARIMPRLLSIFGKAPADVPASLAEPLAASTGPGGKATLEYLTARDRMLAVRISADAIGTQDVLLVQQSRGGSEPSVITITLQPTTHVAGGVVDQDGQPVVDHVVEVWSRGAGGRLLPNTVEFKNGPLRTRADGSFQTPDNLMVGSTYRVAIREVGKDPIFSDWISMPEKPQNLPPFVLRPLRTIRGQVKELNKGGIWKVIALQLIDDNPAEAERLWNLTKGMGGNASMNPTLAWKLATTDPAAARRLIEGFSSTKSNPYHFLFIALGAKARNEAAALDAFQIGVKGIDRLLRENPEGYQIRAGSFLPIVERIDPALVPEVFWLDLSSRLPTGNPRMARTGPFSRLIMRVAWYDREVAAALFEPVRARIDQPRGDHPVEWASEFVAWSLFDPRAAVARLEMLPIDPQLPDNAIRARFAVAESLAQTHEQRWRKIWEDWDIILGGLKRDF